MADSTNSKTQSSIPFISLFTGAMGLDLGLERIGFRPIVCNEIDPSAVATIRANRSKPPLLETTITDLSLRHFEKVAGRKLRGIELVAGGPPCQAFSVFGKRKGVLDERGMLLFEFVRIVRDVHPQVFLMENVRGLLSMSILPRGHVRLSDKAAYKFEAGSLLRETIRRFEAIGYRVDCFVVNAVNYGAPQLRERLLLIGNKYNMRANFPAPRFSNRPEDGLPPFRTLGDAIGNGFKDPDPALMNFSERKLRYLALVPPGGNWRSLPVQIQKESMGKSWYLKGGRSAYWRKLSFEFPCPTLMTMPNHAGTSMCHPSELRTLTVGEMAAVQEFPREWKFVGTASEKCRQVGNAVPVRLGMVAGKAIRELLGRIESERRNKPRKPTIPSTIVHVRPHVRTRTFWKAGKAFAGDHSYYHNGDEKQLRLFEEALSVNGSKNTKPINGSRWVNISVIGSNKRGSIAVYQVS